jgi:hypothetical protein
VAKEKKDGLRTKLGEIEVGQEPRLRRDHIPLPHATQSELGVKNLTRLRLEHRAKLSSMNVHWQDSSRLGITNFIRESSVVYSLVSNGS